MLESWSQNWTLRLGIWLKLSVAYRIDAHINPDPRKIFSVVIIQIAGAAYLPTLLESPIEVEILGYGHLCYGLAGAA